jgi:hypothetical protein
MWGSLFDDFFERSEQESKRDTDSWGVFVTIFLWIPRSSRGMTKWKNNSGMAVPSQMV